MKPLKKHQRILLLTALILVFALAGPSLILAQDAATPAPGAGATPAPAAAAPADTTTSAAAAPATTTKTLWQQILDGGWVMVPIAACSIATIYLIADGIIRTGQNKIAPTEHTKRVQQYFQQAITRAPTSIARGTRRP